jgi:Predicted transcriptional regulator
MENTKKIIKLVNMRAFREMNELSQKEVAEFLEVSIAFVSAVERGQAKLPAEKLVKLLENDRDWETSALIDKPDGGTRIHHDHRSIGQNIEGEFNAPVHNYNGYSEEEFEKELARRTELMQQEIDSLKAANLELQNRLNMTNLAASQYQQTQQILAAITPAA